MQKYKRLIVKLSGELFQKDSEHIYFPNYDLVAKKLVDIKKKTQSDLCVVVGAGNILRGKSVEGTNVDRVVADYMGMLGTILNGMGLYEAFVKYDEDVRLMTAVKMESIAEPYFRNKALDHLKKKRSLIFAGGIGSPFFTTDTAVALRASELNCDLIIKATTVDGVYDKDPNKYSDAKLYKEISYETAISKELKVMDTAAFALCQKNNIPIIVCNVKNLDSVINGTKVGTLVISLTS